MAFVRLFRTGTSAHGLSFIVVHNTQYIVRTLSNIDQASGRLNACCVPTLV